MIRSARLFLLASLCVAASSAYAQDSKSLTRDEVALYKKKLVAIFEALGQAPSGYTMERESYNLPTDAYPKSGTGQYNPTDASANREYGSAKSAEKASDDLEKEYKKKMMEAQAKGDYQEMSRLAQEMQKKMGELSLKTEEGKKEPIHVDIGLNIGGGGTIDPDAVLHEQPGVIALKDLSATPEQGIVRIYFDPVSLKDTKQLSKVSLNWPEGGVAKRTTVLHATITFNGPSKEIEAWAKKVDFKKVLSQIDR
jgi:hypothetical protein